MPATPRPPLRTGRQAVGRQRAAALAMALAMAMAGGTSAMAQALPIVAGQAPSTLPGPQLKLAPGRSASVVDEPRRLATPQPLADPLAAAMSPSLGLAFRAPPASRDGPRALLRVQLSGDAALQFRPRRGGLAVSYRAEF